MNSKNGDQKALAMIIKDHQAPGLVAFLKRLPHGTEAAFVRGVLYQWLLENQDTPDFEERLTDVVNGPGGRILAMPYGAVGLADPVGREPVGHERVGRKPGPKPGSRMPPQASPKKPPETQGVMPSGDAPRQTACGQELPLVAAVETLAPQPVPAPELLASPSQVADPIQVGQDDPQGKHRKKPPMKNWTASLFR